MTEAATRAPQPESGRGRGRRGRRTAHTASQLTELLGWTPGQMARALAAGTLPAYDLKTPRWSGGMVEEIEAAAAQYTAAIPDLLDAAQVRARLGLDYGAWRRGRDTGVLPGGDVGDFYSLQVVDALAARSAELRARIPPPPLGARRSAQRLSEATGRPVDYADITVLAERGLTSVIDHFEPDRRRTFPLYDVVALDAIATDPAKTAVLDAVIAERRAWISGSVTTEQALDLLPGWSPDDLERQARLRSIARGRLERWGREEIAALAADRGLVDQVRRDQLLWPRDAARFLRIRYSDFTRLVRAGLLRSGGTAEWSPGGRRGKIVTSDQYRRGDLEDLAAWPGADWDAAHRAQPRDPSPFREITARATLVRDLGRRLGAAYGVGVSVEFRARTGVWAVTWEPRPDQRPTLADAADVLQDDLTVLEHADDIELEPVGRSSLTEAPAEGSGAASRS